MRNSRLSLGHVIMILLGLLAFLLTLTLIRGRDQTFRVAVASRDIAAGTPGDFSVPVAAAPETALAVAAAIGRGEGPVQLVRSTGVPAVAVTPSLAPSPTPSPSGA